MLLAKKRPASMLTVGSSVRCRMRVGTRTDGVRIRLPNEMPDIVVLADKIQAQQVLLNLLPLPNSLDRNVTRGAFNYQWQESLSLPKRLQRRRHAHAGHARMERDLAEDQTQQRAVQRDLRYGGS